MHPSDYSAISFPSLGIQVDPGRGIQLGAMTIYYYGIVIALGLMLAVAYACHRAKDFGLKQEDITDGVLWITPFAILCARIYYVAFSWADYAEDPITALYIWEGGIAIYGGVLGAVLGMWVFCKKRKMKFTTVLDLILMVFLIGQSVGRWGNFFNREAFGAPTDSFLRMGLFNTKTGAWEFYHPTFLYESVWNALGFVLLASLCGKRKYDGQVALGYAAWYGLGRAFIEGLRMDSLYWGNFRVSQVLAAITCATAVAVLIWQHFRPHDPADLYVNQIAAAKQQEQP